jgi:2-polyprenyl-3-methyl-5-hydroxy-6-metoxy-1,4-benzoquinol methylase
VTERALPACHVCAASALELVPGFETLARVTSDCKPWRRGGHLGVCAACGVVQKAFDPQWAAECRHVYSEYSIYHQASDGAEQAVFDSGSGGMASRSDRLIDGLVATGLLRESGRLIDVGCGNGVLLAAVSRRLPQWNLAGLEISDVQRRRVEAIPNVERLFVGSIDVLPGGFDVVTLGHTLEHIANPTAFLTRLRHAIVPGGVLVVLVPNAAENPYDYLVVDHASHFTAATLSDTVVAAGYDVAVLSERWIAKELALIARPAATAMRTDCRPRVHAFDMSDQSGRAAAHVRWLQATVDAARGIAREVGADRFGVFGTSIAGTWLGSELEDAFGFFVDEDPSRIDRQFLNRPVYHPRAVPSRAHVYLGVAPLIAATLRQRLQQQRVDVSFHAPAESWVSPCA